jgi:hypothetical protein
MLGHLLAAKLRMRLLARGVAVNELSKAETPVLYWRLNNPSELRDSQASAEWTNLSAGGVLAHGPEARGTRCRPPEPKGDTR